jgi:PAP2 superfamily
LHKKKIGTHCIALATLAVLTFSITAPCQTAGPAPAEENSIIGFLPSGPRAVDSGLEIPPQDSAVPSTELNVDRPHHGLIIRSLKRGLQDQKGLYLAPFQPSNLKWDALFLVATGAFLATDRRFDRALPNAHVDLYRNMTNVSLDGTSGTLIGLWAYGIKKKNEHAKETGELELETLANTFLIYTPMQFIAGRERPEEGTGNGRFGISRGFNTSFPAGHPMFTWAMATVVAKEYPKPWVRLLAYGAATSVSVGRFLGREHFASDVLVGSVLGYAIASHIFHTRCDPERSEACPR